MAEPDDVKRLADFEARLKAAQGTGKRERRPQGRSQSVAGAAVGLRIAAELLAALAVGAGLGFLLDRWLDTRPWLLVVGFVLGCGAAMVNVMRTAREIDMKARLARERAAAQRAEEERGSRG